MNNSIPWVEKYRPSTFDNIVLDPIKRVIFENIISKKSFFPNLIFFGPPGTGKTTTIINLIKAFHLDGITPLIIHLNASDERGIDIIRTHIMQFVCSTGLFKEGMKLIILDEIDYMTRSAQTALKYLIEHTNLMNVRFCLICNYISRVDFALAQNFMMFRFNLHPRIEVFNFLNKILETEKIQISSDVLTRIIDTYKSDLRSMINYIQINSEELGRNTKSIEDIISILQCKSKQKNSAKILSFHTCALEINCRSDELIKKIINHKFYVMKQNKKLTPDLLRHFANIYHSMGDDCDILIMYVYKYIL